MAGTGSWRRVAARKQTSAGSLYPSARLYKAPQCSFVLWGDQFDETAAVIFVSALRQVGMKVKIVGLSGPTSAGMSQLTLSADLTLGEALAQVACAACLVVPCSGAIMRRFENDPRLFHFLSQICLPQTKVILKDLSTLAPTTLEQLSITPENLASYSASDDLMGFAHYTAQTLASATWAN